MMHSVIKRILVSSIRSNLFVMKPRVCTFCDGVHYCDTLESLLKAADSIKDLTGCTPLQASHLVHKFKMLATDNHDAVKITLKTLKEIGFNESDIKSKLEIITLRPNVILNRYYLLEEVGFIKITPQLIHCANKFMKRSVGELKCKGLIEPETVLSQRLLSYLDIPSSLHPPPSMDCQTLGSTVLEIKRAMLKYKLKMTHEEVINNHFIKSEMGLRSFRLVMKTIALLKDHFGLPDDKILRHMYLLEIPPYHIEKMIQRVQTIGTIDLRGAINISPKVLGQNPDGLMEILKVLEENAIQPVPIRRYIDLLTLNPETVKSRVRTMSTEGRLKPFKSQPYECKLIFYYNKVNLRLALLEEHNLKVPSIDLLTGAHNQFNRYLSGETMYHSINRDTITLLYHEFGFTDRVTLNRKLLCHPHWRDVLCIDVKVTLDYLRDSGFTDQEIFKCIFIVLYPKSAVQPVLSTLEERQGIESCKQDGQIKRDLILPLTIYFMEQKTNFDGSAVWVTDATRRHDDDQIIDDYTTNYQTTDYDSTDDDSIDEDSIDADSIDEEKPDSGRLTRWSNNSMSPG